MDKRESPGVHGQSGMDCASMEQEQLGSSRSAKQEPVRLADLPDVLTPAQVAQVLGIQSDTLYEALRTGRIPSVKVGRRYFIPKQRFERFLGIGGEENGYAREYQRGCEGRGLRTALGRPEES